jgi:transposase
LTEEEKLIILTGVDLTRVPGFSALSIRKLISETGIDMSKWKDAKHFSSWLRLSPNAKISGGKELRNNVKRKRPKAAAMFRMCASSLHHSKTFLGRFLKRKKAQTSNKNAITATARKISVIYYKMLKYKEPYIELGYDHHTLKQKIRAEANLVKTAERLGYSLVKT